MSATITIAKEIATGRIVHINDVDKTKKKAFECCECKQKLSSVKTITRGKDWHFRHLQNCDIVKCKNKALHDFAVQIIIDNSAIEISEALEVTYSQPRKEVSLFGKRSDVTVNYKNQDLHFEIYVTNDLTQEKIDLYKKNKVKCVKIDLSDSELPSASPKAIREAVLIKYSNKEIIYWEEKLLSSNVVNKSAFSLKNIFILAGVIVVLKFIYGIFFQSKKRNGR